MAGKADLELLFGVKGGGSISGESGQLIKSQLDSIVASLNNATNSKQRRIALNLDIKGTKDALKSGLGQALNGLDGQKQFKISIAEINADKAIEGVRLKLQDMLSALSVSNGVNITGLKDFLGTEGIEASLIETAAAADAATAKLAGAKAETGEWAGQMKALGAISKSLTGAYQSGVSGKNMIADEGAVKGITADYSAWIQKVEQLRASRTALSADELSALQAEGLAIQRKIAGIQEEQTAQARAAAESERASRREQAEMDKSADRMRAVANLRISMEKYKSANPKALKMYGTQLDGLISKLDAAAESGGNLKQTLESTKLDFSNLQLNVRRDGLEGSTIGDRAKNAFRKFGEWSFATRSMMAAWRTVKKMATAVKELDAAMTSLQIITRVSDARMNEFAKSSASVAKAIGSSITNIMSAAEVYSRLGFSLEESLDLSKFTTMYSKIGGVEISDAEDNITAIVKAFDVDTSQLEAMLDKMVEVGKQYCPAA